MNIASIPSYVPKAAVVAFLIVCCIMAAEIYFSISRNRKNKRQKNLQEEIQKKRHEPELKPLKFPEVPEQRTRKITTKQAAVIIGTTVLLAGGGGIGMYVMSHPKTTSLVSIGSSISTPSSLKDITSSPTQPPSPTPSPVEETQPPSTEDIATQYFAVSEDNAWTELTADEVLAQTPETSIYITAHIDQKHSGIQLTIDNTDYLSAPEDKSPDGDFFIILPRSALSDLSTIQIIPLP